MVALLSIGFIAVAALQITQFFKKKQYKEIPVYFVLMAFALIYAISGLTDWDFPAPGENFRKRFLNLSQILYSMPI